MKPLAALIVTGLLLAGTAAAQRSGGGHSGGGGGHSGGGGGGVRSGGGGGGHSGGYGGYRGSIGGHGGYGGGYYRGGAIVSPFIYPVFPSYGLGSYGYDPGYSNNYNYGYAAPPAPDTTMDYGPGGGQPAPLPPPPGSPYYTGRDSLPIYQAPAPTPQETAVNEGRYYLLAYKDHSVYTALAFWMENGALHYVTPQNAHNQVTLDRLDIDLTKRLNGENGLAFNIVNR